ncbi:MAG: tRNA (adenosine(37)-N6)-dimethylallyltransferase MiaA, partial [bacterium]
NPNGLSRQARQALGYKEVIGYLAVNSTLSGSKTQRACKELIKKRTRLFAKRQMTWFKSFPDVHWVDAGEKERIETLKEIARNIFIKQDTI